ncbi:MAG: UDP-glucose/iron transport system ATP-binding protein [Acidimicrobiaceae bacterium]|jgi:putative ABC transport system ATP-binding protein
MGAFDLERVTVVLSGTCILDEITTEVPSDGVTVLKGPSGAGKSTLLRLCNRLEVPTSGTIRFKGDDIAGLDPLRLRRRVGMVFQRPTLFPGTIRDNLRVALPDGTDDTYVDALDRAGLAAAFLDRTGDELSGGEAQRACLARTLVTSPEVLLMDEPTSALDDANTRLLERHTCSLTRDGVTVLWVTHDLAQADRIADHALTLDKGRLVG